MHFFIFLACLLTILALIILFIRVVFFNKPTPIKEQEIIKNANEQNNVEEDLQDDDAQPIIRAKRIVSDSEAYNIKRIRNVLPDGVYICPQVSFNSFLSCKSISFRNRYNRKMVDLLAINENFEPMFIIEIDGTSHQNDKIKLKDAERDKITSAAGIPTLRIDNSFTDQELNTLIKNHCL